MTTAKMNEHVVLAEPALDEKCSRHFTYRDFIECGQTQPKGPTPNRPSELESYGALQKLASMVLDAVWDHFGPVKLTYGFASQKLIKEILKNKPPRIAPERDQHAAHEKKLNGTFICPRLGAACDFLIEGQNMREVAEWVLRNTDADRVYFYGNDRPVHVSYGPDRTRQFVEMLVGPTGRRTPKVVRIT